MQCLVGIRVAEVLAVIGTSSANAAEVLEHATRIPFKLNISIFRVPEIMLSISCEAVVVIILFFPKLVFFCVLDQRVRACLAHMTC